MITFRVQKIRSCIQCGELLNQKCDKCITHPNRQPRIIELYDWPEVLQTGPCGCLLIKCQRLGCDQKVWRYAKLKNSEGKSVSKTFCCSPRCAAIVANMSKAPKVKVSCSYCGNVKMIWPSKLGTRRHFFCRPDHHYLWERQERFKKLLEEEMQQFMHCPQCKDEVQCVPKNGNVLCKQFICEKGHKFDITHTISEIMANKNLDYRYSKVSA